MKQEVKTLLGFAQRAGKIVSGSEATQAHLRKRRLKLLVLADDTTAEWYRKTVDLACKYGVPVVVTGNKYDLGLAIGKSPRASLGILDAHFARLIVERTEEKQKEPEA